MLNYFLNYPSNLWNSSTENSLQQAVLQNASHNCEVIVWSQLDFLPWDNPDNIVSAEVEAISRITRSFILVFLFLIGGPGNIINMVVFYKQGLKDRVNLCLFALAFADELYLIMAMLHHAEQVYLYFLPKAYGPMIAFVVNNNLTGLIGSTYVSMVLSAIIASERCLCVLYPLKFQVLMNTRTMAVIIIIVYIVVISLYFIVALRYLVACMYVPLSDVIIKTILNGEFYQNHRQIIDYLDGFVFGVGLPTGAVVVVLTSTIATVVKLRKIVTWRADTTSSVSLREVALTKMLVANSILFLVCVFPSNCVLRFSWLLLPEINSGRRHHNFYLSTIWLLEIFTYFNSSLNIVVYYAMGSRYRDTFKSLFVKKKTTSETVKQTAHHPK